MKVIIFIIIVFIVSSLSDILLNLLSKNQIIEKYNIKIILSLKPYFKNKSMIQSAYLHTLFRDNIRILYTKNIVETTTLILLISTKIIDKPEKFLYEEYTSDKCYTDFIKLKKTFGKYLDGIFTNYPNIF